jgi:iron complex outermembrane receptor protein
MKERPFGAAAAALVMGSFWGGPALAQHAEEAEIIVTAPVEGSRIESLQGAALLDRDDIVESLSNGIGDTLDRQPGVATTFFGAGASRPIIRGLGEDRVRVLQNGIGTIDASTVSPDHAVTSDGLDAERIEVLRGAAALAYGGNAVGGVVNVIDQSIPTRTAEGVHGQALVAYSSVDEGTHGAAHVGFGAGGLAFEVSASARDTDPYETPQGEALNQYTSLRNYGAGGAFVGDWGFAGVAVKRTEDEYGLLPHDPSEPGGRIELEQTRIETRGDVRVDFGPFSRLDYGFQHSDYEHTEFEGDGAVGTVFTSEGWEARLEAHNRNERLRGATGMQYSDVDFGAVGEEAFISASNTRDIGLFTVQRLDFGGWGLEAGLRYEQRELENVNAGARDFDSVSASAGVFFRPAENWFLGGTIARTERAPTVVELFSDGLHAATDAYEVGDPDLGQETALSFELSARYDSDPVQFEVNVYRVDFEDYIALVNTGVEFWIDEGAGTDGFSPPDAIPVGAEVFPVFGFTQADAEFTGGEISARARLFDVESFAVSADAALDLVRADFDAGGNLPRIPPRSITLGVEVANATWTGRVEVVDTAKQSDIANFETATDGFTFVNAGLAFRPQGDDSPWTIRLDGRNLTDEEGRVHASFLKDDLLLPGRNFRLSVLANF